MAIASPESTPTPERSSSRALRRRNGASAADEAQLSLLLPIANWQAKFAWDCASWGLIPVAGLPLGMLALVFGLMGWRRVRRTPEALGIRHAVGGAILGSIEVMVNVIGTMFIVIGIMELRR